MNGSIKYFVFMREHTNRGSYHVKTSHNHDSNNHNSDTHQNIDEKENSSLSSVYNFFKSKM